MWNPEVRDVDVIWPKSTYTVPYLTPLPTAALSASISWLSTSTGSLTTTMFLKFPASASQYETSSRADPSLSSSTATETIATKNTSVSSAASVSNSVSMSSSPLSVASGSASSPSQVQRRVQCRLHHQVYHQVPSRVPPLF
ncbi:hypothetical protein IF1G_11058 [Cordyceps javanica]|uniref:Uncharacterized protein n=1 Tax=Cordyceps javanica TaxID=43265 RepID=A0A545ULG2_9HYPO|nr:hypothetical protein IF1G_11058 [Cordyceps javanica]